MSERIKKYIIFAIFIIVLFLSSLTQFFSKDLLWPDDGKDRYFSGIIFQNPTNVEDLVVSRSVENQNNEDLIKYTISFTYTGEDSTARIMGVPARHIFFEEGILPYYSIANLKGDYEKVNNTLFNAKFRLRDFYNKSKDNFYKPYSVMRIPLEEKIGDYSFTVYYKPENLLFSGRRVVEKTSVFITNARMSDFKESTKTTDSIKEAFNDSGYYVNKLEMINSSFVSRINILNTLATVVFLVLCLFVVVMIWFNRNNYILYVVPMFIMISTFYRFIDKGSSNLGIIIIYPILGFIGALAGKLISKDVVMVDKKDLKQSLGLALMYLCFCIIVFIVPRAFL